MNAADALLALSIFVALFPIVTSGIWIAGGLLFKIFDERMPLVEPEGGWPGVTVLVPAYNEHEVIATCVEAARTVDYPKLEVLVLDDGSTDATVEIARAAAGGDPRVEVLPDPVNRGKADRLNLGFQRAQHDLVVVTDADTHLHPLAIKLLVARISRSHRIAAVAGAPHVTNRRNLLCGLQIIEAASIIGLIRRTQALAGAVSVVAGVLGLFRREAVIAVGGYRSEMATEDIDLSWRLLLAGWHTAYEPDALVGMEVPSTLSSLWAQRRRWACGQGEVMHVHLRELLRWQQRRLWPIAIEAIASLAWVVALAATCTATAVLAVTGGLAAAEDDAVALLFAWSVAVAVVATVQLSFALRLDFTNDRRAGFMFLLGPLYPIAYWLINAAAALRAQLWALLRGPASDRVVWDLQRDSLSEV